MLDVMRRQSSLIYLIFGGIIVIFAVNFGPGSSSCLPKARSNWAARVDGAIVRQQDFALLYGRQLAYLREIAGRGGSEFDPAMAERMGLGKQVIDQLIERKVLAQAAARAGIAVGDADLVAALRDQYGVKDVGYDVYEGWVTRTFDQSVARFEDQVRADVAAQQLADVVRQGVTVGDAELADSYRRERDRARVSFVRFDVDAAAAPAPSAAAVAAVLADGDGERVRAFFEREKARYRRPAQVRARQLLWTLPADADEATLAAARTALTELRGRLAGGTDVAELVAALPEAGRGRVDLGWVAHDQVARPLADALFALAEGQVAEAPVRTPEGLHLVKVEERREAGERPFADAKDEAAADLLRAERADNDARAAAERLLTAARAGGRWEALTADEADAPDSARSATSRLPERRDSGWIMRFAPTMPRLGTAPALQQAIFALSAAQPWLAAPAKVGDAYVVARLVERQHPDMAAFKREHDTLKEAAVDARRAQVMYDWLAWLRNRAKVQVNPTLLASGRAAGA